MINKHITVALFAISAFLSCNNPFHPPTPTDNMNNQLLLKQPIYDSIQTFVDFNKEANTNFDAQYYLLEFYAYKADTLDFVLTTVQKKTLEDYYLSCPYFYNKDSTILLVNNGHNALFGNKGVSLLSEITSRSPKEIPNTYNPFLWKLSIVNNNQIIIDRLFFSQEGKKKIKSVKLKL